MSNILFHLSTYPVNGQTEPLKIVYLEYEDFWLGHHSLSGKEIEIPLNLQYYLQISTQIVEHVFEVTNRNITEEHFLNAGFIKNDDFSKFIEQHEKAL
jgi:hypothetical protein